MNSFLGKGNKGGAKGFLRGCHITYEVNESDLSIYGKQVS